MVERERFKSRDTDVFMHISDASRFVLDTMYYCALNFFEQCY